MLLSGSVLFVEINIVVIVMLMCSKNENQNKLFPFHDIYL